MEPERNPNIITHELKVGDTPIIVADDLIDGYGDAISFAQMVEDAVGEKTGRNDIAVDAGERARETYDSRGDLALMRLARWQRQNKNQPQFEMFVHPNGHDTLMTICAWDKERECQVGFLVHCHDRGGDEIEYEVIKKVDIRL